MSTLKTYDVPVSWVTYGRLTVKAHSKKEAIKVAKKATMGKYMSECFLVNRNDVREINSNKE